MRGDLNPGDSRVLGVVSIHAPRMRGDRSRPILRARSHGSFNPRPSHEGRLEHVAAAPVAVLVSIHAPRMRGDAVLDTALDDDGVSIHAPRMRGDPCPKTEFAGRGCFNPRPSHEGRHCCVSSSLLCELVSIHAPRMRGDTALSVAPPTMASFQSTPLA